MLSRPSGFASVLLAFAPLFRHSVWDTARLLMVGAILAPGQRTVASVLRILGRADDPGFQDYHRLLNRVCWSPRQASRILLPLLVKTFALRAPLVVGLDDTMERRGGPKDPSARHRSRPGALRAFAFCQNQRSALAQPPAAGPDFLGRTRGGFAVPDRAGCFGTLLPETARASQKLARLGRDPVGCSRSRRINTESSSEDFATLSRASKPSGHGMNGPSPARHPACWRYFR